MDCAITDRPQAVYMITLSILFVDHVAWKRRKADFPRGDNEQRPAICRPNGSTVKLGCCYQVGWFNGCLVVLNKVDCFLENSPSTNTVQSYESKACLVTSHRLSVCIQAFSPDVSSLLTNTDSTYASSNHSCVPQAFAAVGCVMYVLITFVPRLLITVYLSLWWVSVIVLLDTRRHWVVASADADDCKGQPFWGWWWRWGKLTLERTLWFPYGRVCVGHWCGPRASLLPSVQRKAAVTTKLADRKQRSLFGWENGSW